MLPRSSTSPARRARRAAVALAAGCALIGPAAADARPVVTSDGTNVVVTGTDEAEIIDVHVFEGHIEIRGADLAAAPGACYGHNPDINDQSPDCPFPSGGIVVDMGGGNDKVHSYLADAPKARFAQYDLGPGDDFAEGYGSEIVQGGPGTDEILGYDGDDELDGGDGNDKVSGGAGADTVRGGAGDDDVSGDPMDTANPDVIDGGPGRDTFQSYMFGDPSTAQMPTVTLDGVADDGFPGEGDNVTNMELVESYGALRFAGTDGDDLAKASEVGNKADLTGKGGNDELWGTDREDTINGGAGDDKLYGRYGNDTIVGGPGKDTIAGDRDGRCNEMHCDLSPGSSADTIDAVDGEVDTISCGPGTDTVKADAADVVDADCETVTRAGGAGGQNGGGNGGGANNGGSNSNGGSGTTAKKLAVAGKPTLRALAKSGIKVTVSGRKPGAKVAVSLKKGKKVVAKGSAIARTNGSATVKVKLTKAGRKALARAKSATLTLVAGTDKLTLRLKR